jgi:hypothetical protein
LGGIESEREREKEKGGGTGWQIVHAYMAGWGFMRRERRVYSIDMRGFALCFCAWCGDDKQEEEGDW